MYKYIDDVGVDEKEELEGCDHLLLHYAKGPIVLSSCDHSMLEVISVMMITLLMMVEMLETNPQKSVLHWKQGSSYIRDRLLQEQSTRRHKWKFPEIFLFRFSQVDQQSHLQEHAIAFKVPR